VTGQPHALATLLPEKETLISIEIITMLFLNTKPIGVNKEKILQLNQP
jgi:hypothetical protein